MRQGWAVLMMDVQGCHLRIASVKMIDPGPQRGRLKFTALEFNSHCASPQVRYSADDGDDHSTAVCSSHTEGRARIQLAWRADGLNDCSCLTSADMAVCKCLWGESYSHYRWITKQALACQLWSVSVKVVNMSTHRCCSKSLILTWSKSTYCIWLSGSIWLHVGSLKNASHKAHFHGSACNLRTANVKSATRSGHALLVNVSKCLPITVCCDS